MVFLLSLNGLSLNNFILQDLDQNATLDKCRTAELQIWQVFSVHRVKAVERADESEAKARKPFRSSNSIEADLSQTSCQKDKCFAMKREH